MSGKVIPQIPSRGRNMWPQDLKCWGLKAPVVAPVAGEEFSAGRGDEWAQLRDWNGRHGTEMLRDRGMEGDGEGDNDHQGPKGLTSIWPSPCRGRKEEAAAVVFSLLKVKDIVVKEAAEGQRIPILVQMRCYPHVWDTSRLGACLYWVFSFWDLLNSACKLSALLKREVLAKK